LTTDGRSAKATMN